MSAPFGHFRTQRRVAGQSLVRKRGPQIGKPTQRLAKLQQSCFGPAIRRQGIEFVAAHRSQQHRIAFQRRVQRGRRQRRARLANGLASDGHLGELEVIAAELCHRSQNAHGFARDFRADPVSGADQNFQFHCVTHLLRSVTPLPAHSFGRAMVRPGAGK